MKHTYWIIENEIAGRPGPDLIPWKPAQLYAGGIRAVLTLTHGQGVDPKALEDAGLMHYSVPITISQPPSPETVALAKNRLPYAYKWAFANILSRRPVLVHCFHGNDRTGLFLLYYLVRQHGLAIPEAMRKLKTIRPEALCAYGWENLAYELIPNLAGGHK